MKRTRLMTLLLALSMVLAMSQMAMAESYEADGGSYKFNGKDIVATGATSITDQINTLVEPGDSITIELTYTNDTKKTTEWYMENTVIDTLEAAQAKNGGYTYILKNVGPDGKVTEIFNSDAVGGEGSPAGAGTGLEQATNATEGKYANSPDYFFIQTLAAGQSGKTQLEVALDGESQINSYQEKDAEIEFSYAVEEQGTEDIYKHVRKKVYTGDMTNLLLPAAAFLASLLLLILAVKNHRKDRKDGDKA